MDFSAVELTVSTLHSPGDTTRKKSEENGTSVTTEAVIQQHYFDRNDFGILSLQRSEFSPVCQERTLIIKSFCMAVLLFTLNLFVQTSMSIWQG